MVILNTFLKSWFTDSDCCVESVFLGIRRKNYESGDNVY